MKILITGSKGNLGSALTRRLASSAEVLPADRTTRLDHAVSDFSPRTIVHCAFDLKTKPVERPAAFLESNLALTGRLLELALRHEVRCFAYVSSAAALGEAPHAAEHQICRPKSVYGLTKLLNEQLVTKFCQANGMAYVVFRPFNIFGGTDQSSVVARLLSAIEDESEFSMANDGIARRDFIHVDDVARVMSQVLCRKEDLPTVCHIGTGRGVAIRELVAVARAHGYLVECTSRELEEIMESVADIGLLHRLDLDTSFERVEDFLLDRLARVSMGRDSA